MKQKTLLLLRALCWGGRALVAALLWLSFAAPAEARVLIIEVAEADEQPALRLVDLLDAPAQRLRVPQASEPENARALLQHHSADQAVVLDSEGRRVHVVMADGAIKTRVVEGDPPAAYVMAFVAVELLALHGAPPAAPVPSLAEDVSRTWARYALRLGVATAAPYVGHAVIRAQLGADVALVGPKQERYLGLMGLLVETPGRVHQSFSEGQLKLERWDVRARGGALLAFAKLRLQLFAEARMGLAHVARGPASVARSVVSAGPGAGIALELPVTRWLSFYGEISGDWMGRRARYRVAGEPLLRERAGLWTASLGVLLHTPL